MPKIKFEYSVNSRKVLIKTVKNKIRIVTTEPLKMVMKAAKEEVPVMVVEPEVKQEVKPDPVLA